MSSEIETEGVGFRGDKQWQESPGRGTVAISEAAGQVSAPPRGSYWE